MPTYTLQPDATDGIDTHIIDGTYATLNYGTSTQMPIGHQHLLGVDVNCHGLFRFSLAAIPSDLTIVLATFILSKTGGSYGDNAQFYLDLLARTDWIELEATWNRYKAATNWTVAGGDVQPGVARITSLLNMADSELVFAATPHVVAARSLGRSSVDWIVSSINPSPILPEYNQYTNVYSSDETTPALRPKLVITTSENYTVQAGQLYTAGAVAGLVMPNVVTGEPFTASATGGDVK